jgi:hypothetical protein
MKGIPTAWIAFGSRANLLQEKGPFFHTFPKLWHGKAQL